MVEVAATPDQEPANLQELFLDVYRDHSRTLRTWLVAYGVGGPALILTQQQLAQKLIKSGCSARIVVAFLAGVGAQILLALLNKWCAWQTYDRSFGTKRDDLAAHVADALNKRFWIDSLADVATLGAFGYATVQALLLLLS